MKNVTITLDDEVLADARVLSAERGKSLSAYIADLLRERLTQDRNGHLAALEEFLTGPGFPGATATWRGRDELYDHLEQQVLPRHQSADLRPRPTRTGEAQGGGGFAEDSDGAGYTHAQPPKPE